MAIRKLLDERPQPRPVVDEPRRTMRVHDHIVPGWDNLARLGLGGVPARRDIGVRTLKDHQRLGVGCGLTPDRVGARDVAAQRSERPRV